MFIKYYIFSEDQSYIIQYCPISYSTSSETIFSKMEEHGVVPDVIDSVPKDIAEVSWDSGVKAEWVTYSLQHR